MDRADWIFPSLQAIMDLSRLLKKYLTRINKEDISNEQVIQ